MTTFSPSSIMPSQQPYPASSPASTQTVAWSKKVKAPVAANSVSSCFDCLRSPPRVSPSPSPVPSPTKKIVDQSATSTALWTPEKAQSNLERTSISIQFKPAPDLAEPIGVQFSRPLSLTRLSSPETSLPSTPVKPWPTPLKSKKINARPTSGIPNSESFDDDVNILSTASNTPTSRRSLSTAPPSLSRSSLSYSGTPPTRTEVPKESPEPGFVLAPRHLNFANSLDTVVDDPTWFDANENIIISLEGGRTTATTAQPPISNSAVNIEVKHANASSPNSANSTEVKKNALKAHPLKNKVVIKTSIFNCFGTRKTKTPQKVIAPAALPKADLLPPISMAKIHPLSDPSPVSEYTLKIIEEISEALKTSLSSHKPKDQLSPSMNVGNEVKEAGPSTRPAAVSRTSSVQTTVNEPNETKRATPAPRPGAVTIKKSTKAQPRKEPSALRKKIDYVWDNYAGTTIADRQIAKGVREFIDNPKSVHPDNTPRNRHLQIQQIKNGADIAELIVLHNLMANGTLDRDKLPQLAKYYSSRYSNHNSNVDRYDDNLRNRSTNSLYANSRYDAPWIKASEANEASVYPRDWDEE